MLASTVVLGEGIRLAPRELTPNRANRYSTLAEAKEGAQVAIVHRIEDNALAVFVMGDA
ncbi:MAG: hypothetical protein L0H15_06570 [Nitrosospira sp.]|nr:hypothetical protein [Nitrosospira sp.]